MMPALVWMAGLAPACLIAQTPSGKQWSPPRTPDGQPDIQGNWSTATLTPLERPAEFAGKEFLTPQEAAEYEKRTLERVNSDRRDGGAQADLSRNYNEFWRDRGTTVVATRRTSLVVDPPDGKVPPLTPEARKKSPPWKRESASPPRWPPRGRSAFPMALRICLYASAVSPAICP